MLGSRFSFGIGTVSVVTISSMSVCALKRSIDLPVNSPCVHATVTRLTFRSRNHARAGRPGSQAVWIVLALVGAVLFVLFP